MRQDKRKHEITNIELIRLFDNEETQYIEKTQRMPKGVKVWHPDEIYKNVKDDLVELP